MNLLPFEIWKFCTKNSKENILSNLHDLILVRKKYTPNFLKRYLLEIFGGVGNSKKFIIKRKGFRSYYLPYITGEVKSNNEGAKVSVTIKINAFIAVISALFYSAIVYNFFVKYSKDSGNYHFVLINLRPWISLLIGYSMFLSHFKYFSKNFKNDLLQIFEIEDKI